MIERLEKAGLGFFVKDSESHQKLGKHDIYCKLEDNGVKEI